MLVAAIFVSGMLVRFPQGAQPVSSVVAPGSKLVKQAMGFSFTEGPTSDSKGNVYFTDQPNDRILKWSTDGRLSTFLTPAGRSNGLCFDARGQLWACADGKNELWKIDPATRRREVVLKDFGGKLFNGPNDVWVRPDEGLYFTDPYYQRPYWNRGGMEQDGQHVYYLAPHSKTAVRVISDLQQPNGIVGTPDGKTLYVADIGAGRTYSYEIQKDGTLKNARLLCRLGSDGMTLDNEGNVYLTGQGVTVFSKDGKQVDHIDVPEGWTANVCFGGKDMKTLFITASGAIYTIKTRVKGAARE